MTNTKNVQIPRMYEYTDLLINFSPILAQCSRLFSKNKRMCGSGFMCIVSVSVSKNHAIYCMMFVLALNDTENIPLFEKIIVVCVSFTNIPPTSNQRYTQLTDKGWPLDSNGDYRLFINQHESPQICRV